MSSTNRSAAREKHVSDFYVTPERTIVSLFSALADDNLELLDGALSGKLDILDPCAGGDAKHPMAYPSAIEKYSDWEIGKLDTADLRNDSRACYKTDYIKWLAPQKYDVIITNPPFNIALNVIQKALQDVKDGGLVIMLLRLNFFGSQKRQPFWHMNMPVVTYVHTERCHFLDTPNTDSIEYMHAIWRGGVTPKWTALRIID